MPTLWNADDRAALLARFERLAPSDTPKWGSFTAPRMVTHVTDAVRAGLGELAVKPVRTPFGFWPMNALVIRVLPWPKGAPTAPELMQRVPEAWDGELAALKAAIDRFAAREIGGTWSAHAAFGNIDGQLWGRLMYRHLDHHLTQFGR